MLKGFLRPSTVKNQITHLFWNASSSVSKHQFTSEREASRQEQTLFLPIQMYTKKTSDPMSPFRELRKSDFQQTTTATYQKPLELRTATQRQQQLISYFCDLQLHSDKLDVCWGSRAHASTTVQKYSARTFSLRDKSRGVKSHIFAPLLLLLPSLLQMPLSFPRSLLNQEAKYVYEGCTSKNF